MKVFYFILFAAMGVFCIAAAVMDWKWYIGHWADRKDGKRNKSSKSVRLRIGVIGALLTLFGFAVLFGWL